MRLWVHVVRRTLLLLPVLIGIATAVFALSTALPVDQRVLPYLEPATSPDSPTIPCPPSGGAARPVSCPNPAYQQAEATIGIGSPVPVQWGLFLLHAFTGQWGHISPFGFVGTQLRMGAETPVAGVVASQVPYTAALLVVALLATLFWTSAIGRPLTAGRTRPAGRAARWAGYTAAAFPVLMTASILLWLILLLANSPSCATGFDAWFGSWPAPRCFPDGALPSWLSYSGRTTPTGLPFIDALLHGDGFLAVDTVRRLLLPATALSITVGPPLMRRWEAQRADRAMDGSVLVERRALGFEERAVGNPYRSRISLSRSLRELGLGFSFLVGAVPIVEYVFGLHGLGSLLVAGLTRQLDWGCILATFFVLSLATVFGRFFLDVVRASLDPRARDEVP